MRQETAAFVCSHIFHNTQPVLLVAREGGDWMYLCGSVHSEQEEYHVIGMEHLFKRDNTLLEVRDLPDNTEAERRCVGAEWIRMPLTLEPK